MSKKILCGLDIGTNSVGWCLTDENNKIIKKQGKRLWGVRMFDEAESCAERRGYRSNRRRLHRRKERIDLLRSLFKDEISKVDNSFFYRLDESMLHADDKKVQGKYSLFNDKNYTDIDFYKEFPTIYHLRKHLLETNDKVDIRLLYLALHHMIKYRGHFLTDGDFSLSKYEDINNYFKSLNEHLKNIDVEDGEVEYEISFSEDIFKKINAKYDENPGIKELQDFYKKELNQKNIKYINDTIVKLLSGGKVQLKAMELGEKSISTRDPNFDETISDLLAEYPDKEAEISIIVYCKKIYDSFLLGKLLSKKEYLSDVMIEKYNLHKKQLRELKEYVGAIVKAEKDKGNKCSLYYDIFRKVDDKDDKANNYVRYVGFTIVNKKRTNTKHCSSDEFYKFIKEKLDVKNKTVDPFILKIMKLMENNEYLSRQNSSENSIFPYQLNKKEMRQILMNQSKHYSFLSERDEYGTVIDKIVSILEYKIPYYVGPLTNPNSNEEKSKYTWVKRTEEKIYPWNFDKVVDKQKTAEVFITRMLNKCTYLPSEYCLPKSSLVFSYFNLLQCLNKICINGSLISPDVKQDIIHDLYMNKRKVNYKHVKEYIKIKYGEDVEITTPNEKELSFSCDLASYIDLKNIFGKEFVDDRKNLDLLENIIRDITIFEDKKILEERLFKEYKLKPEQVKRIKGLNYTKFSSLSNKLLTQLKTNDGKSEVKKSIIKLMEETNQNLQEILYNENYNFESIIKTFNIENGSLENVDKIEDYVKSIPTLSPGMKRPLIQAYKICEELEKIVGQPIDEYYVECTRHHEKEKKISVSRYDRMMELYDKAKESIKETYKSTYENLKKQKNNPSLLNSKKYYLYFAQLGKCMYSGEPINFEDLQDDSKYDIDHIIPQSMIKDDSLNNLVLVKQELNKNKSDIYPIPHKILFNGNRNAANTFYNALKSNGFITEEKYSRIMRREISENELSSFVNRQLVYTNQAVKGFINAIKHFKTNKTHEPKIVFTKAEIVSDFRNEFDLIKSRIANNFHHAHDAYLNIIVGRTVDSHFNKFKQNSETLKNMHAKGLTTNPSKIFKAGKEIYDNSKNLVWKEDESIKEIEKNIYERFDILCTKRPYINEKLFKKVSILSHNDGNIPIKTKGTLSALAETKKYGGYKEYVFGSYSLIKANNKFSLEAIPTMVDKKEYLSSLKYKNYEIVLDNLKINTVIESEKKKFCITGKTGSMFLLINMRERVFNEKNLSTIHKIEKVINKVTNNKSIKHIEDIDSDEKIADIGCKYDEAKRELIISPARKKGNKEIRLSEEELITLYNTFVSIFNKDIYSYSIIVNIGKKLKDKESKFKNLTFFEKTKVLYELCNLLKCNERKTADLKLLDEKNTGTIILSKNNIRNCRFVYESITGFYRKVVYEIK